MGKPISSRILYDPDSGSFRRPTGKKKVGWIAGGYLNISIDGKKHRAHRVAWFIMTGRWPDCDIDHINGNRDDNRWSNLRLATRAQNQQNAKLRIDNSAGLKGVTSFQGKWKAQITVLGRRKHLGMFVTKEAAHDAYKAAADTYFGRYARAA